MAKLEISIESSPQKRDIKVLSEELSDYLVARGFSRSAEPLAVFLRDRLRRVVGGVYGETYSGWLNVQRMWVAEQFREQGYGTELLRTAEQAAVRRGCRSAYLATLDPEAASFYERLGYTVFGELREFVPGHTVYFMQKPDLNEWGAVPESVTTDV